jgi:hypothetical protein
VNSAAEISAAAVVFAVAVAAAVVSAVILSEAKDPEALYFCDAFQASG